MPEDTFHDVGIIDECNDAHGAAAVGAFERIDLVNLLNQSGPVALAPRVGCYVVGYNARTVFELILSLASRPARKESSTSLGLQTE